MKSVFFSFAILLTSCVNLPTTQATNGHVDEYHRAVFSAPDQDIKSINMGNGPFDWRFDDYGNLLWSSKDDRGHYITSVLPGPGRIVVYPSR